LRLERSLLLRSSELLLELLQCRWEYWGWYSAGMESDGMNVRFTDADADADAESRDLQPARPRIMWPIMGDVET
jgi:hypothetical protein